MHPFWQGITSPQICPRPPFTLISIPVMYEASKEPRNALATSSVFRRYQLKVDGSLWMKLFLAHPEDLAAALEAAVKDSEPLHAAIRQYLAEGKTIEGVEVKRRFHLRIS